MEKLIRGIRKVPLWLWLFLALTQFVGVFSSYSHWQTAMAIAEAWREPPESSLISGIQKMESIARSEYREIWMHSVMLVAFLACAVIKRRENAS